MDPKFDLPPDKNYVCTICNQCGIHFKSLCPKNTDPLCIFQKRRARGITTPPEKGSVHRECGGDSKHNADEMFRDCWELGRLNTSTDSSSSLSTTNSNPDTFDRIQEIEYTKSRLLRDESVDMEDFCKKSSPEQHSGSDRKRVHFNDPSKENGHTSKKLHGKRKRARISHIESHGMPVNNLEMIYAEAGRLSRSTSPGPDGDTEMVDGVPQEREMHYNSFTSRDEDMGLPWRPKWDLTSAATMRESVINQYKIDLKRSDAMAVSGVIQEVIESQVFSEVVQGLIAQHPEMRDIVNFTGRRLTAVDMWGENDHHSFEVVVRYY